MKKNKLAMGLSLTFLIAFWGGSLALAKGVSSHTPMSDGNPIKTQNHRQKMPNSARKAAAARLRPVYQQKHQRHLNDIAHAHHGYTGHGRTRGG